MFLRIKVGTCLLPALLLVTCEACLLFETCYKPFPKFANPSNYDLKSIIEDINEFYTNFSERYNELEMFIKHNMSQSNDVDVKFYLYTQEKQNKPETLQKNSLKKSNFNPRDKIKVLLDGLQPLENFADSPIASLKHALLLRGQYNVIVVDYKTYARMPYTKAVMYSYLVAKNAADFLLHLLKTFKLTAKRLHLIGFGFGGQVVSNIGSQIPRLARITALDPAGALFDVFSPKYRLSPDDADFVDVIHTSAERFPKGLGFARQVGDQDFFPNGGKKQPGCAHDITAKVAGSQDAADFANALCDHKRAIELYVESVCDRICTFKGTKCDNYVDYKSWFHCISFLSERATMGFYAKKNKKLAELTKFYLDTNSYYPFCSFF